MRNKGLTRVMWGTAAGTVCAGVLLWLGTATWAGEAFEPGKGWQEANPSEGAAPDVSTDAGQLQNAQVLWEAGKLKRCEEMCRSIIKQYKTGAVVEQTYVLLVKTEAALGKLKEAEKDAATFRKKFPESGSASAMADAEMDIMEQRARSGDAKTLRRLEQMVDKDPYGARADRAQLLAGNIYLHNKNYLKARDAYDVVLRAYPQSRYRVDAEFGKGKATYLANQGLMHDAGFYIEAEQILKGVLEQAPEYPARAEVEKYLKDIHNLLAERQFRVGRYYEGQHRREAAAVYYREVIKNYGDTSWAAKAKQALGKLGLSEPTAEPMKESPKEPTEGGTGEKTN